MDAGSEAADLMVREGLQIAEATVKLLAAGSKNLAAFLYALAKDNKRVSGKTNMGRLLREGKELRVFQLRESDLAAFSAYAKKGILYAVVKDKNAGDGLVDLITNVDFASQVNLFLERHGYEDVHPMVFEVCGYRIPVNDDRLAAALAALLREKRDVILLSYFMDMSDREIGELLDMARRTVQHRRTDTLAELRKRMEDGDD